MLQIALTFPQRCENLPTLTRTTTDKHKVGGEGDTQRGFARCAFIFEVGTGQWKKRQDCKTPFQFSRLVLYISALGNENLC